MRQVIVALSLIALLATGCRVSPRAEREIALLRAEILDLEDQYYALKSRCQANGVDVDQQYGIVYDQGVGDAYCENCTPGSTVYPSNSIMYDSAPGAVQDTPRVIDESHEVFQQSDPLLESQPLDSQGESSDPSSALEQLPQLDDETNNQSSLLDTRSQNTSILNNSQNPISSVVINRNLSKGQDVDGQPGDEGLVLLIQPIDATGAVKKIAGHLTVRIVEPTERQVERQIGMWQFSPEETASFFVKDEYAQQGILLHLPWDGLVPRGKQLNVFVRYVTEDLRNVNASIKIPIEPPARDYSPEDPLVAGWIERDERWKDIFFDSNANSNSDQQPGFAEHSPEFPVKSANTERRTSTPQWRPVR